MSEAAYKRCVKCGEHKPLTEFHRDVKSTDGRRGKCKPCISAFKRERRQRNPEAYLGASYRWKARNHEKIVAADRIYKAVRDGKIQRPTRCDWCEKECRAEGHHPDYSKPLEVVWLCRACHVNLHRSLGESA